MTATDNKSYLGYLNKLVDDWNKSYHCFIDKKIIDAIILLWLKKLKIKL